MQRLPITAIENVVSNAERRGLVHGEAVIVPRVSDIYAALPAVTGKIELEYEGELKGAEQVARELVRQSVATVFDGHAVNLDTQATVDWFNNGGELALSDTTSADDLLEAVAAVPGIDVALDALGVPQSGPPAVRAAAADFYLEGLCALRRISRSDEGRMSGAAPRRPVPQPASFDLDAELDDEFDRPKGRKKYYN